MVNPSKLKQSTIDKLMMEGYDIPDIMTMSYSKIDSIVREGSYDDEDEDF